MTKIFDGFRESVRSMLSSFEKSIDDMERSLDLPDIDVEDLGEGEEKIVVVEERRADGSIVTTKTVVRKTVRRDGG